MNRIVVKKIRHDTVVPSLLIKRLGPSPDNTIPHILANLEIETLEKTNTIMHLFSLTWYKVGYGRPGQPPVIVSLCEMVEAFQDAVKRRIPRSSFWLGRRGGAGGVGVEPREKEVCCIVGMGVGEKRLQ